MRGTAALLGLLGALTVSACTTSAPVISEADGCRADFICGLENAEDLERVQGTPWVIASSVGLNRLYRIDIRDRSVTRIFPDGATIGPLQAEAFPDCPAALDPTTFVGHGLAARQGARPVLYAVNHGRHAIEVFDLDAATGTVAWIGCIPVPADMSVNGVAPMPDGGLVATKYATPGVDFVPLMAAGAVTGELRLWRAGAGWSVVTGTEGSVPNGVAVSADGATVYVTLTGTREIMRIDLSGAEPRVTRAPFTFSPDNLRWTADGRLLTAGFTGSGADAGRCFAEPDCMLGYGVASIDPVTLHASDLAQVPGGGPFGNASAALEVEEDIWIGTFRGDRLAIMAANHIQR